MLISPKVALSALGAIIIAGCASHTSIPRTPESVYVGTRHISAPDVESGRDHDGDEATPTDRLSAMGRLLAEAKRELEYAEWLVFLRAIYLTEETASFLIALAALDRAAQPGDDEKPDLSLAQHMPVVDLDATRDRYKRTLNGIRHIGADVAPLPAGTSCDSSGEAPVPGARWCGAPTPRHHLPRAADHAGVAVSYGRIRDGVGRDKVIAWLQENAIAAQEWGSGFPGLGDPYGTAHRAHCRRGHQGTGGLGCRRRSSHQRCAAA